MSEIKLTAHNRSVVLLLPDPADHIQRIVTRSRDWYERDLLEDVYGRVHHGTVIDVGAHIGNHTSWFAGVMRRNVIAIEPNPASAATLRAMVERNRFGTLVTVMQAAVGAEMGRANLLGPPPGNTGMTRTVIDVSGSVPMVTIDSLGAARVGCIKIDMEGDATAVLDGASATIARDRPIIYAEAEDTEAQTRLDAYMSALGYVPIGRWARTPVLGYIASERLPQRPGAVSAAIMAHPARAARIPGLLAKLEHPAAVVLDHHSDRWETGRRALLAYDPGCRWHCVIQDDAVLPRNLIPALEGILERHPERAPLCLYLGNIGKFTTRLRKVGLKPPTWVTMPGLNWGVGIVVETAHIPDIVAFGDARPEPNYDLRISRWYESQGRPVWYPVPSLVNHDPGPSLVPGRGGDRVAWQFCGASADAAALRFRGVAHLDMTR